MMEQFDWLGNPTYIGWLYDGIQTTIGLSISGIILMLIIGTVGAFCLHYRVYFLARAFTIFVDLFRNTPPLVQLFLLYFTLPELDWITNDGLTVSGFTCVVIILALYNGSLAVEVIRSGLESVPKSTVEAAQSLGYKPIQIFYKVELPIGFRISFSYMINNVVSLIKTSSQASLVSVGGIMFYANRISLITFKNFGVMMIVLALYLTIVSVTVFAMRRLENRIKIYGYGK